MPFDDINHYSSCNEVQNGMLQMHFIRLDNCFSYGDSCQCTYEFYLSGPYCERCPAGCASFSAESATNCPSCVVGFYHAIFAQQLETTTALHAMVNTYQMRMIFESLFIWDVMETVVKWTVDIRQLLCKLLLLLLL